MLPLGLDYKSMARSKEQSVKITVLKRMPIKEGEFLILCEISGEKTLPHHEIKGSNRRCRKD